MKSNLSLLFPPFCKGGSFCCHICKPFASPEVVKIVPDFLPEVLYFTFIFRIHLEVTFVEYMGIRSKLIWGHILQNVPTPSVEKTTLSPLNCLCTLVKHQMAYLPGPTSALLIQVSNISISHLEKSGGQLVGVIYMSHHQNLHQEQ